MLMENDNDGLWVRPLSWNQIYYLQFSMKDNDNKNSQQIFLDSQFSSIIWNNIEDTQNYMTYTFYRKWEQLQLGLFNIFQPPQSS